MSGVKRACTTRTGTGSSSQEQEVADPMMTLERQMEYLKGRPVAKEPPVTLSDFDQLFCARFLLCTRLVDRASEVQLEVRGVQFLFSADVIADFLNCPRPESPCFPAVPLTDEQRTSEQDLWTLMTGKTSAVVGSIIKQNLDSRVSATVKATLQPVERQMQSLEEQLKELRTAFDGECTVTMLRNKSVVAHMADVSKQLEEIKKTLDDFKTEANPQRIPRDIPDEVATFRDAVRR
ncbi:hypothetical protein CJ030_MR7G027504 [Morella rubra]|uniref:Uncharacterized protein n=1 Tax=Morella rubra TaxID=262757 RepID=A0A6A1V129_9ROSI|nr:hypothetical protein CJ030_MR7G027504 [Morella rubra]